MKTIKATIEFKPATPFQKTIFKPVLVGFTKAFVELSGQKHKNNRVKVNIVEE